MGLICTWIKMIVIANHKIQDHVVDFSRIWRQFNINFPYLYSKVFFFFLQFFIYKYFIIKPTFIV